MPHKMYKHVCRGRGEVTEGASVCRFCGQKATFGFWSHSVVEFMGRYQERSGLKALGPHRQYADRLLALVLTPCGVCGGTGLIEQGEERCWQCSECAGRGTMPAPTDPFVQEIVRLVCERYPDARPRRRWEESDLVCHAWVRH
jgi:hypothetical protein